MGVVTYRMYFSYSHTRWGALGITHLQTVTLSLATCCIENMYTVNILLGSSLVVASCVFGWYHCFFEIHLVSHWLVSVS